VTVNAKSGLVVRVRSAKENQTVATIYDDLGCTVGRAVAYALAKEANEVLGGANGGTPLKHDSMVAFPFELGLETKRESQTAAQKQKQPAASKGVLRVEGRQPEPADKTSDQWVAWRYSWYMLEGKSAREATELSSQDRSENLPKKRQRPNC
jgi:hypothetical protein